MSLKHLVQKHNEHKTQRVLFLCSVMLVMDARSTRLSSRPGNDTEKRKPIWFVRNFITKVEARVYLFYAALIHFLLKIRCLEEIN